MLAIAPQSLATFKSFCERERCPFAVLGVADGSGNLTVADAKFSNKPVDMPLEVLLGKPPQDGAQRRAQRQRRCVARCERRELA